MYKRRRIHRPQIPFDAQNAISLLETCDEEFKEYHAFSIEGVNENEIAIGFMSPKWRNTFQPRVGIGSTFQNPTRPEPDDLQPEPEVYISVDIN